MFSVSAFIKPQDSKLFSSALKAKLGEQLFTY